jgi:hypothetical protein
MTGYVLFAVHNDHWHAIPGPDGEVVDPTLMQNDAKKDALERAVPGVHCVQIELPEIPRRDRDWDTDLDNMMKTYKWDS